MKLNSGCTLFLIFLLGFMLRFYKIDCYGLYFDEKVTLLVSQAISPEGANQVELFKRPFFTNTEFCTTKTINDFFIAVARGDWGNSPLHYLFLHFWILLFGITDLSVRFSSLFWSISLIPLIYFFVKSHFVDSRLAVICAFLTSIEPFFIAQSHIVRNYSMSIFLTLYATHFLFVILNKECSKRFYFYYAISVTASLLCHYLTFPVFIVHDIIFVLYNKNTSKFYKMVIAMFLPLMTMLAWLIYGGGKYSYKTMQDVAAFYKNIAHNPPSPNPYVGLIDKTTFSTVTPKLIPVLSDLFIATNSISTRIVGNRNILVLILFSLLTAFLMLRLVKSNLKLYVWLLYALIFLQYFCYSINPHFFTGACFILATVIVYFLLKINSKRDLWVLYMIGVPILLMLFQVLSAGHTFSINQRYLAFTFPFAIILCGQIILFNWQKILAIRPILMMLGLFVLTNIFFVLNTIYKDENAKYTFFAHTRKPNPHAEAALLIQKNIQVGDTVYLPNINRGTFEDVGYKSTVKSVFDSQLINLYLCKKKQIVEKISSNHTTKLFIKKADGKVVYLYDFKNKIY